MAKILYVEDNEMNRDMLSRRLKRREHEDLLAVDGKEGFVMTLQTREQHIRRERATSNICTNQGLIALRSVIFLSLLGKKGLPELAKICYQRLNMQLQK